MMLPAGAKFVPFRFVPTEPGSPAAREYGCSCPEQVPQPTAEGGLRYQRDPGCPLHRRFAAPEIEA
jgi:hypothetical protein